MAQNIYDDEEFFAAYSRLRRSTEGLDGAPEWPVLRGLLPPIENKCVVDLGCGFGWFCRWATAAGAESVRGIDLSHRMLERARADTDSQQITYERNDLEAIDLGAAEFDLAFSSLTLHYVVNLDDLFEKVQHSLSAGGRFVFSVEHPIFTAPASPGFVGDKSGSVVWPLDGYLVEGPRATEWLAPGVIKQHRTIGTYLSSLHTAGFRLNDLIEWGPSGEQIEAVPEWAVELDRPQFLLVSAMRE